MWSTKKQESSKIELNEFESAVLEFLKINKDKFKFKLSNHLRNSNSIKYKNFELFENTFSLYLRTNKTTYIVSQKNELCDVFNEILNELYKKEQLKIINKLKGNKK